MHTQYETTDNNARLLSKNLEAWCCALERMNTKTQRTAQTSLKTRFMLTELTRQLLSEQIFHQLSFNANCDVNIGFQHFTALYTITLNFGYRPKL